MIWLIKNKLLRSYRVPTFNETWSSIAAKKIYLEQSAC